MCSGSLTQPASGLVPISESCTDAAVKIREARTLLVGLAQGRARWGRNPMALKELVLLTEELSHLAERLKEETHAEARALIHRRAFELIRQIQEESDHE